MSEQLNLNPFPDSSAAELTEKELANLFMHLKSGNDNALEKFASAHGKYVEQIILGLQERKISQKKTFTELYEIGIAVLKKDALKATDLKNFEGFFAWSVRQAILKVLV
jgi:hypothetical protein